MDTKPGPVSAFERQFGSQPSKNRKPSPSGGERNKMGKKGNKIGVKKGSKGVRGRCRCDCPDCGKPSKRSSQDQTEKSIIDETASFSVNDSDDSDRAIKMKLLRSRVSVRCPRCKAVVPVRFGPNAVVEEQEEEEMDDTDSLYEIKDAYENWTRR